ncbi:MAG: hypothetical protein JKY71_11410 [Alphaproteobacteria bacterium]|nr:hypothetical protein [Alphaproteobacteria bacterium]
MPRVSPSQIVLQSEREYLDNDLSSVLLQDFKPSELSLAVLQNVCAWIGSQHAALVGGDLTAEYARQKGGDPEASSRDRDIHVNIMDTAAGTELGEQSHRKQVINGIADDIRSRGGKWVSDLKVNFKGRAGYGIASISFYIRDHKVDLSITDDVVSAETRAMYGDAIVKSIAANREGKVYAHPYFEEDMQAGEYTIRVKLGTKDHERAVGRYEKRVSHLRNFELVEGDAYAEQLTAEA